MFYSALYKGRQTTEVDPESGMKNKSYITETCFYRDAAKRRNQETKETSEKLK